MSTTCPCLSTVDKVIHADRVGGMTRRARYLEFLRSDFWKEMTSRKKALVGECERCGSGDWLQSHHKIYRADWYETRLEDLEVLCRGCHREEHGIAWKREWLMVFRGDVRFSRFLHWIGYLNKRLMRLEKAGRLKGRERRYLERALEAYPPEPTDTCMEFQVQNLIAMDLRVKDF